MKESCKAAYLQDSAEIYQNCRSRDNERVRYRTCTIETGKIKTPTTQERDNERVRSELANSLTASARYRVGDQIIVHHAVYVFFEDEKFVFVSWFGDNEARRFSVIVQDGEILRHSQVRGEVDLIQPKVPSVPHEAEM